MVFLTEEYQRTGSLTLRMTLASGKAFIRSLENRAVCRFRRKLLQIEGRSLPIIDGDGRVHPCFEFLQISLPVVVGCSAVKDFAPVKKYPQLIVSATAGPHCSHILRNVYNLLTNEGSLDGSHLLRSACDSIGHREGFPTVRKWMIFYRCKNFCLLYLSPVPISETVSRNVLVRHRWQKSSPSLVGRKRSPSCQGQVRTSSSILFQDEERSSFAGAAAKEYCGVARKWQTNLTPKRTCSYYATVGVFAIAPLKSKLWYVQQS